MAYNDTSALNKARAVTVVNNTFVAKVGQSYSHNGITDDDSGFYPWLGRLNYPLYANGLNTVYYSQGYAQHLNPSS